MRCVSAHIVQSLFLNIQKNFKESPEKDKEPKKEKAREKKRGGTEKEEKTVLTEWNLTIFHMESLSEYENRGHLVVTKHEKERRRR